MTRRRRPRFLLAAALSLAAGITCADGAIGPSSGPYAQVALAPSFTPSAARIAGNLQAFGLDLDTLRIRLMRGVEGPAAKDTIFPLANEQSEVRVELLVALKAQEERMTAIVELRSGNVTMFMGAQELVLRVGRPTTQTAPLELEYIGPGANATVLRVNPDTATLFSFQSLDFTTTAYDATGAPVSVAAIAWLVTDPTRGTISPTGRFTASAVRGQTYVVALMPTGVRDSAIVSVVPTVSQVEIVSGGGQTATVGSTLGIPIVVETRAADNLPVPGSAVRFLAYQGGGSLTTTLTQSDANGRASTVLTLGTTAGVNTVLVMSGTDTLVVTATATAGAPVALAMVLQPSGAATSGVALTTQPSVRVVDAFGNAVAAPDLTVRASASGITGLLLGGNSSAITNASGVAVFTNLTLTGPIGSATLSFSSGNLTPVTSTGIALALAAPGQVVIASGDGQGALPGFRPLPNPIVVRAMDAGGSPRVGAIVTFQVDSGGGLLNGDFTTVQATTDANGHASVLWSTSTGQQRITASTSDASVQIRAFIGQRLVVVQQPTLDPQSGARLAQQPAVRFIDNAGNVAPINGAQIVARLTLVGGGAPAGFLSGSTALTTDQNGIATFTDMAVHGPGSESVQLRFHHQDGVSENTQVLAGLSSPIGMRAGPLWQILTVGNGRHRVVPSGQTQMTFRVLDLEGFNGVPGIPVSFTVPQGMPCAAVQSLATSNAAGEVTVSVVGTTEFTSCYVQARVEQDVIPPSGPLFRPLALGFLTTVATGVPTWVGADAVDPSAWALAANWFDDRVPASEPIVFVPGFVLSTPRIDDTRTIQTLRIENSASLDLNSQTLNIMGDLVGGGYILGTGTVVLRAIAGGVVNVNVPEGMVQVGNSDPPCARGTPAYAVQTSLFANMLELNCELLVGDGAFVTLNGDLRVGFFNGGLRATGSGSAYVVGNARFDTGVSSIATGGLTVQGSLNVAQPATLNQSGGVITVIGDAGFHGSATMTAGTLDVGRNFLHTGNGQSDAFLASHPHRTILRGTIDPLVIQWNTPGASRFGRLEIASQSPGGYQFITSFSPTVPVHDLYILPSARLVMPSNLTILAGGQIVPFNLGVHILTGGTLVTNGARITVIANPSCNFPPPDPVGTDFHCVSPPS